MLKSVVIACLSIAYVLGTTAQEYAGPAHLSGRSGLSHRWINDIMQDSRGFLWFSTIDGLNRYDGNEFVIFRPSDSDPSLDRDHDWIWWTVEDSSGQLSICTKGGIHRFDVYTSRFTYFPYDHWRSSSSACLNAIGIRYKEELSWKVMSPYPWKQDSVWLYRTSDPYAPFLTRTLKMSAPSFFFGTNNLIWIWNKDHGWIQYNIENGTFQSYGMDGTGVSSGHQTLPIDISRQVLWAPVGDEGETFLQLPLPADETFVVENFLRDEKGDWWLTAGENPVSLFRFEMKTQSMQEIGALPIEFGFNICEDNEGTIWVGHQLGITRFVRTKKLFENYLNIPFAAGSEAPLGIACRSMVEDPQGNIYIEDQQKLYRLAKEGMLAEEIVFPEEDGKSNGSTPRYLFTDSDGEIWMSIKAGIAMYDPFTGNLKMFEDPVIKGMFFEILEDKQKRFWIRYLNEAGEYNNVLFDKSTKSFSYAGARNVDMNNGFMQPDTNLLWAFHPKGLLKIDCANETVDSIYLYDELHDQRQGVFLGDHLWIASSRGLVKVDMTTWKQSTFNRTNGLPADFVYSLLPDDTYLWLGTADGLCRFNIQTNETQNYYTTDGLSHNEFNTQAVLKTRDGRFIMGGLNGINIFRPETLRNPDTYRPHLKCIQAARYDGVKRTVITTPLAMYDIIPTQEFHHRDKSFAFRFALTSYRDSEKNRYAYYLEGLDEDWREYSNFPEATYAHLPPGRYVLHVKAMDPNGIESANLLSIPVIKLRPWYGRWWALFLYGLLLVGVSFIIYRHMLRRRLEIAENMRLRELDALKTRIYTSITHEFRTPLTIILGLTRQWLRRTDPASVHENEYRTVERNGQRLLELVNQMLDLRKLEAGKMEPNYIQGDVTQSLRYVFDSFHSYAIGKEIDFQHELSEEPIVMDYDPDMLTKIISNLLSNAIKFTPEGGSVKLIARMNDIRHTHVEIVVTDSGEGIKKEDLPFIFTKFFQADNALTKTRTGTGIGLTLTKELVELLKGEITVESIPHVGTSFKVMLPITHDAEVQDTSLLKPWLNEPIMAFGSESIYSDESIVPGRACVLIVEDNAEVASYTASCLGKDYQVRFAANGEEGIRKAFELIPDLVISDVMMPLKDGFELLHTLKEDLRTSHIPVILLTARAETEDRLEGLRRGADAYLNKPFIEEELQILTAQLLQLRKKLQKRYAASMAASEVLKKPDEAEIKSFDLEIEDAFYRRVLSILEANFENTSFSNEELYRQMHMSRTQLHRKLAALTGYSPNQLLLQIRLRNAKKLLSSSDTPVSEIAYSTGFNQPSYFARAFAKETGMSPSEYRAQQRS